MTEGDGLRVSVGGKRGNEFMVENLIKDEPLRRSSAKSFGTGFLRTTIFWVGLSSAWW
jgi:hypothetical protein